MSARVWPPAIRFEPGTAPSADLELLVSQVGTVAPVVLLIAGAEARRSGWAADAAIALADAWARLDGQVVLVDAGIGEASLHEALGLANEEGLADLLLFGGSLGHLQQEVPGRSFSFLPPGIAAADAKETLRHAGWRRIIAERFRSGSRMLVYARASEPGLADLARRVGGALPLAAPGDEEEIERTLPEEVAILGVLMPGDAAGDAAVAPASLGADDQGAVDELPPLDDMDALAAIAAWEPDTLPPAASPPAELEETAEVDETAEVAEPMEPEETADVEELPADWLSPEEIEELTHPPREDARTGFVDAVWARRTADAESEPASVDPVAQRVATAEEQLDEPIVLPPVEPPGRRRGMSLLFWLALGAAVALGILFGARALLSGGDAPAAPAVERAATPAAAAPPAAAKPLPYSVAIAAYQDYPDATARAAQLAKDQSDITFFISPMKRDGVIYYRVLAGPVADSAGAVLLMQRLLHAGVVTGASEWYIRPTRYAFKIGDFPSRADADARAAALASQNIPTYAVELPLADGDTRYRLYAGAFEGAGEAEVMRPLLKGANASDTLVERIGRPTQ